MKLKKSLSLFGLLTASVFFLTQCEKEPILDDETNLQENEVEESNMVLKNGETGSQTLRHFILVEFIDDMSDEQKEGFTEALIGLKDSIEMIADIEWGKDLKFNNDLDQNFENCYMVTVNSLDDFLAYLYHPSLEYFHSIWLPFVKNVMVFDYWAEDIKTGSCGTNLRNLTLFKYKEDISEEQRSAVIDGFSVLPNKIREIREMEWGSELLLLGLNQGYTDGFFLSFNRLGDYVSYLRDYSYKKFIKNIVGPNVEDVLILEYMAQPREYHHGRNYHNQTSHGSCRSYQRAKQKALF